MALIKVNNLAKSFSNTKVLKDISFEVNKGDVVTIIGSSGSGKSTLLRCINLLEKPTSGSIIYNDQDLLSNKIDINKVRSKLQMVFQNFNIHCSCTSVIQSVCIIRETDV